MIKIQIYAAILCSLFVITGCSQKKASYLNADAPALWLAVEDEQAVFWKQRANKNRSFRTVVPEGMYTCLTDEEVYQASRLEVIRRHKSNQLSEKTEVINQSKDLRYSVQVNRKMWDHLIARTYHSIIRQKDERALKRWIDYHVPPGPAFVAAAQHNNPDALMLLLKAFPEEHLKECVHVAVRSGHINILTLLVKQGASLTQVYERQHYELALLDIAIEHNQEHIAKWIIANQDFSSTFINQSSALHQAVRVGNMNLVKTLVSKGMGLNHLDYQNATPLLLADLYNRKKIKAYLMEAGAIRYTQKQINQYVRQLEKDQQFSTWQRPTPLINALNQFDLGYASFVLENGECNKAYQPLLVAIANQWESALLLLLQNDVDVNQTDDKQQTALIKASQAGLTDLVEILINKGAAINFRDTQNLNALYYAARAGHWMIVERLLEAGADSTYHDFEGRHALFFAEQAGKVAIVERILRQPLLTKSRKEIQQLLLNTAVISGDNKLVEDQVISLLKNKVVDDPLYYLIRRCICNKKLTLLKKYLTDEMNVHFKYRDGQTMLHLAVQSNYPEMVAWLLLEGADKTELNSNGLSAEHYARKLSDQHGVNVFDILDSRTQK